jgi:anti-sigma factor RsiW
MMDEPTTLERLLSERADGVLGASDAARLERALAESPALCAAAGQYERLAGVLSEWRPLPAGLDTAAWRSSLRERVEEQVAYWMSQKIDGTLDPSESVRVAARFEDDAYAQEIEREFLRAQEMLDSWSRPLPAGAGAALSARVRGELRHESSSARRRPAMRWIGGLAMAASVAIAAVVWRSTGPLETTPADVIEPVTRVVRVAVDRPSRAGRVMVEVDRSPPPDYTHVEPLPRPTFGLATGSPSERLPTHLVLDEVVAY